MRLLFLLISLSFFHLCDARSVHEDLWYKVFDGPPQWIKEQIDNDFKTIEAADVSLQRLDAAMAEKKFGDLLLVRYLIYDGQIVVHSTTPAVQSMSRFWQLNQHMTELARLCRYDFKLPNCEFIVSLHDAFSHAEALNTVVFSFARSRLTPKVVLIPDTDVLMTAEDLQGQIVSGNHRFSWESKKEIAFWRGVTTGGIFNWHNYREFPRFQLVEKSLQYPDLVDAKFTNFCQGAEYLQGSLPGYGGGSLGVADHMKYKYQILVDGNSCAYSRAYWQLFGNSVILKHDSDNIQWYYQGLRPYEHYIPVAADFSDLIEKINWAMTNDEKAREINWNAQCFAHGNLLRADFYYYLFLVINHYARLQESTL